MRSCLIAFAFLLSLGACRTPDGEDASATKRSGGTTVGNGRLVPIGVAVHFGDADTKRVVQAIVADAKAAGKLRSQQEKGDNACFEFKSNADMKAAQKKICKAVKAGNARKGSVLTRNSIVLNCGPEELAEGPGTNDEGC
jgi:hypothetical protein